MGKDELKSLYAGREREPDMSESGAWTPKDTVWL
jgi:hypothetical protein